MLHYCIDCFGTWNIFISSEIVFPPAVGLTIFIFVVLSCSGTEMFLFMLLLFFTALFDPFVAKHKYSRF